MTKIDRIEIEAAFMNIDIETSYWLDRKTGKVLSSDDWSRYEARKLDDPDETENPNVRLAWCLLWENAEVGSDDPDEEERAKVGAIMDPLIQIPWYPYPDEDRIGRDVDDWVDGIEPLNELDED